jgi:hypothetical protein
MHMSGFMCMYIYVCVCVYMAQVVRALVLAAFLSGLRFESLFWGQPVGEVGVLPSPYGGGFAWV